MAQWGLVSLYGGNKSGPGPGWAGGGAARPGPGPPGAGSSARIPPEAGAAPPSHLARCPRPLRAGAGRASVSRRLWVRPAGRGLQGQGGSGRDVKTVQAGGGLGGPGPADPAPRLPPCRTVTSCCRPCSPRPGCAPWRCPRTCSWTAGAPRGPRPSACEPPGSRSRSAPASCSWASSPGTTGPPSPTGSPGQPETFRPIAKPAYSPATWSSRSAVDLSCSRRLSSAHNGGSAFGAVGYGGALPAAPMPPRPVSYHERGGGGSRVDYDTLSVRSLRLGPGGLDDHCSVVSEQLEPSTAAAYRAFAYERQASASASASSGRAGGLDWPEAAEGPPSRTIRAPAMRTLQRFQSSHRSRVGAGVMPGGVLEPVARAPSVRSLSLSLGDAGHLPDVRGLDSYGGQRALQRLSSGFDDIDLPSAVKYLMASDPNLQVLGAAYIQHKCYSDAAAKKQARSLQAVPRLVKLFNHANQEVQRHATGAMRNLIYDNADNKLALVEENGIFELLRTLREQDDELRKNVTGILWNLSSSDHLKDRLARDTLEQLTDLVLSPLSGAGGPPLIQQNASEAEIFYNATGFLRNLSSASQATRQKMRECHGLVDALVTYINQALDVGKCEDKSVENAVCVLRNLSYRLYDEMPPSALQRLEGRGRRDMAGAPPSEVVGCFTPQSRRLREQPITADALTFAEVSKDPKGLEWLWSPQIVGLYNRLLQRCELNRHTTEAAAGALQNITAGDRRWAGVLSRLALEQERILNPLLDRVRTADHHQLRSLTGLIRNLSRNARNKDEMSTKVVSHLIEKLPGSVGEKCPPADVLVNIIAVLNNLVVASPIAARDLLYFDGLRKLVFIKKKRDSPDSEKSSRAASSLLANLWQYNKLHRDFRAKGYRKEDFLGP